MNKKIVYSMIGFVGTGFVALKLKNNTDIEKYDKELKSGMAPLNSRIYNNPPFRCKIGFHAKSKITNRCVNCGAYL